MEIMNKKGSTMNRQGSFPHRINIYESINRRLKGIQLALSHKDSRVRCPNNN